MTDLAQNKDQIIDPTDEWMEMLVQKMHEVIKKNFQGSKLSFEKAVRDMANQAVINVGVKMDDDLTAVLSENSGTDTKILVLLVQILRKLNNTEITAPIIKAEGI